MGNSARPSAPPEVRLSVRFRGQFARLAPGGSLTLSLAGKPAVTLTEVLDALQTRITSPDARELLTQCACFCNGRLLKPQDLIEDNATIHILSPVIGG